MSDEDSECEEMCILDRFTDPGSLEKRKELRREKRRKRISSIIRAGKKFAEDYIPTDKTSLFNIDMCTPERSPLPTVTHDSISKDLDLSAPSGHGFQRIAHFYTVLTRVKPWQSKLLKFYGWSTDCTDYDAISACHSTGELEDALFQWASMVVRQTEYQLQGRPAVEQPPVAAPELVAPSPASP